MSRARAFLLYLCHIAEWEALMFIFLWQIVQQLEGLNPTKEPLKSPLLNGKWKLIYTTSSSILKKQVFCFGLVI